MSGPPGSRVVPACAEIHATGRHHVNPNRDTIVPLAPSSGTSTDREPKTTMTFSRAADREAAQRCR